MFRYVMPCHVMLCYDVTLCSDLRYVMLSVMRNYPHPWTISLATLADNGLERVIRSPGNFLDVSMHVCGVDDSSQQKPIPISFPMAGILGVTGEL